MRDQAGFHQNGSGDAENGHGSGETLAPPFNDLSLIPNHFAYTMIRPLQEVTLSSVLRTPSLIFVDAGSPKVQVRLYGGVYPGKALKEFSHKSEYENLSLLFRLDYRRKVA